MQAASDHHSTGSLHHDEQYQLNCQTKTKTFFGCILNVFIVSEHWPVDVVNNGYRGNFSFRFSPFVVKPDHCLFYQQMVHFMEKCLQVTCVHFLRTFLFGHLASGNHVGRRGGVGVSEEGSKGSLSKFIEILSACVNGINTT